LKSSFHPSLIDFNVDAERADSWSTADESGLLAMRRQGMSFAEIAGAMNRTELSVACKYLDLVPLPE
jgi:hypothetical protein